MLALLLFLLLLVIILAIVGFGVFILLQAAIASAKLSDAVHKISPATYQDIWSFRPFYPVHDRLNKFLESNHLDDIPQIYAGKKRCRDTQAKLRKLFSLYLLFILIVVVIGGVIAIVQSS